MPNKNGLELIKPTSVTVTGSGSSATINANGSVTFSSVDTMYVNNVFSSTYDNYMMVIRMVSTASNDTLSMRMSNSGTATSDTNYTLQYIQVFGSSLGANRLTTQSSFRLANPDSTHRSGTIVYIYGPNLAQPTAMRDTGVTGFENAILLDFAGTHSTATAYDGFWLDNLTGLLTGRLCVYGMRK